MTLTGKGTLGQIIGKKSWYNIGREDELNAIIRFIKRFDKHRWKGNGDKMSRKRILSALYQKRRII